MKRICIVVLSLLCSFVWSCQKSPQDLLIGTWQVNRIVYTASIAGVNGQKTMEPEDTYYLFSEGGTGKYWQEDHVINFTYTFNEETNTIFLTLKNSEDIYNVETLTKDEFIFHAKASVGSYTAESQYFCTRVK